MHFSIHKGRLRLPLWRGACVIVAACMCGATSAATLRWAPPADALSLDPHAQNEVMSNSFNAHLYERLVTRDANLALVPGLPSSWRQVNALTWRFQLRPGVRFHDGSPLTGEDVVFSVQRAQHPASAVAQYARSLGHAVSLGGGAVEFQLDKPNPVFLDHVDAVPIMNLAWSRRHGVMVPLSLKLQQESHAKHHAMGTGPFVLSSRQPDTQSVLSQNPHYWGRVPGNVSTLIVQPIGNALTRSAALVKGDIDIVTAPALNDLDRLAATPGTLVRRTRENRVVFLGFDQKRDELLYSNVKGRNPLKDARVRQAIAHALDMDTVQRVLMRDLATPTGCMLPSALTCSSIPELDANRPAFDPSRSRQLLNEAGYPDGFELTMDCPNDRNVNDEALCVAMAGMLAKVGIALKVHAMPRSLFFPKLDRFETSAYLMAWGGAELDAQPTMDPLMHSYDSASGRGEVNFGRFSDPRLDALIQASGVEANPAVRKRLVREALLRHQREAYHVVLYRQTLAWAMRDGVSATPAANNHLRAWLIRVAP